MRGKTGADREISVNTYTGGFTTMRNHHLRNRNLSLKAVGLLSKMLSLPPDWDYSIRGLAMLNTDGIDGIRTAMKELEDEGYVVRVQSRDENVPQQIHGIRTAAEGKAATGATVIGKPDNG